MMEILDRSNENNYQTKETAIEFGNFENENELGSVETSFGDVAAPIIGFPIECSRIHPYGLEQLLALMQM